MTFFGFHPELFEHRALALERLDEAGYVWLTDFSCVDLLHQEFGLEVAGIASEAEAETIGGILSELFPDWCFGHVTYREATRDPGWKIAIHKFRQRDGSFEFAP